MYPLRVKTQFLRNLLAVSDTVIEFNGFTMVQLSHSQAAVVSDPKNRIFVIRDCGFIAYAVDGRYDVLSVVNPTNLPIPVTDPFTKVVLGRRQDVKMKSKVGMQEMEYLVATLYAAFLIPETLPLSSDPHSVWIFLHITVSSFSVERTWNFMVPGNSSSRTKELLSEESTHAARIK